jgi:parallel beta-helix repeat protein
MKSLLRTGSRNASDIGNDTRRRWEGGLRETLSGGTVLARWAAGVVLAALSVGQAAAVTVINAPTTINAPGSYALGANLNNVAGTAIIINADGVSLDLRGFTIDGTGSGDGIQVTGTSENIGIRNGKIQEFCDGIEVLSGARNVSIRDMKIGYNKNGVLSTGADGISVFYSLVVNNKQCGIDLRDGDGHHVCQNRVARNGSGYGGSVDCNSGIFVQGGKKHEFVCNTAHDNVDAGLELRGIRESLIYNNTAEGNGTGIALGPSLDTFQGSNENVVMRNRASINRFVGIVVATDSTKNRIEKNVALNNDPDGPKMPMTGLDLVDGNTMCDMNTWRGNTFRTDQAGAVLDGGPTAGCIR